MLNIHQLKELIKLAKEDGIPSGCWQAWAKAVARNEVFIYWFDDVPIPLRKYVRFYEYRSDIGYDKITEVGRWDPPPADEEEKQIAKFAWQCGRRGIPPSVWEPVVNHWPPTGLGALPKEVDFVSLHIYWVGDHPYYVVRVWG